MGTKGVPFGYLEFSRAIRGKPCPRASPLAAAGRAWARVRVRVLFEPGLTGIDYHKSYPLRHPDPNPKCNGSQQIVTNSWAVAVRNDPLQRFRSNRCNRSVGFGPFYLFQSAINSAPFLSIKTHRKKQQSIFCILKWDFCTQFRSDFQQEVRILQIGFRSDFQEILKNSFWKKAQKIQQIL